MARRSGLAAAPHAGFTLIEILVVLVIVGLISATLLYAFQRVLDARLRLSTFLDGSDTPNLVAGWFRDSVDGMMPDVKGGPDAFEGAVRTFTGLTVAPLNGMAGVPTRITWDIVYDDNTQRTYLRYRSASDQTLTIASWPEDRGGFHYCGPDLTCYDSWPPPKVKTDQVPALIRLDLVKGTEAWAILAAPTAAHNPIPPPLKLPTQ